jgi:hypothetical protein
MLLLDHDSIFQSVKKKKLDDINPNDKVNGQKKNFTD